VSAAQEDFPLGETNIISQKPDLRVVGGTAVDNQVQLAGSEAAEAFKAVTWWPDFRANPLDVLTPTELEVAGLIGLALGTNEVADRLDVTAQTVKFHTSHIFEKFDVDNRTQAGIVARRAGVFARAIEEAQDENADSAFAVTRLAMRDVRFGEDHQVLPQSVLTRQEQAVLTLISHGGMSNKDVAQILWITEQTAKFHASSIYKELDLRDRSQLAFVTAFAKSGIAARPINL
jgi:DNA-binding NarL/FixJ family response regulator